MVTIEEVRRFWDANPLWTGETAFEPGSREFFEEHRAVYYGDCFAGKMDERIFPEKRGKVLDLGCGVGFWPVEFWQRGFRDITAADLSPASLDLARKRANAYGATVIFAEANAESLPFADGTFDHVNCLGVVHHTVSPERAVAEIHRVLKPGGTATISVYYKNAILRHFDLFRPIARLLNAAGAKLKGRGRESIYAAPDVAEIVRLYDGAGNPKGIAYDRDEFADLLSSFRVDAVYFHFFPARSLPVRIPKWAHRILDGFLPFMIYANVTKAEPAPSRPHSAAMQSSLIVAAFVAYAAVFLAVTDNPPTEELRPLEIQRCVAIAREGYKWPGFEYESEARECVDRGLVAAEDFAG